MNNGEINFVSKSLVDVPNLKSIVDIIPVKMDVWNMFENIKKVWIDFRIENMAVKSNTKM